MSKHLIKNNKDMQAVADRIAEITGVLDDAYGGQRKSTDMGGYILFFPDEDCYKDNINEILEHHHLAEQPNEYKEIIHTSGNTEWWEELYLQSSDDSLTLIYPQVKRG